MANDNEQNRIATKTIHTEQKKFHFDLIKNNRGTVLKVTEDVRGRRNTIMIPAEALNDAIDAMEDMAEEAAK